MKKVLVIGSTVADVIVNLVERLPKTGEDVHVKSQQMSLGGCAYNVSDSLRHFQVPYLLFSPVGTGVYGHFVREELKKRKILTPIPTPEEENGCCYCLVENTGERTFICYHGAEYRFRKEWFSLLNMKEIDTVYICGLEIEEATGPVVVEFLERHPDLHLFFAPGPRLNVIEPALLERIFHLSPVLHLNETEALSFSHTHSVAEAAAFLYRKTGNIVIVTLAEKGCYYFDGNQDGCLPAVPTVQADATGAGDSHIGSVIACLKRGDAIDQAIAKANRVASAVVSVPSALLPDENFQNLGLIFRSDAPSFSSGRNSKRPDRSES